MKAGHAGPKTADKQHSDMQIKTTYKIHTYKNMIIFNHGGHSGKQDTAVILGSSYNYCRHKNKLKNVYKS